MKKGFKNKMKSEHQPDIKSSKHIAAGTRKLAHKFLEVPFLRATHLPIGQHLLQNFKLCVSDYQPSKSWHRQYAHSM